MWKRNTIKQMIRKGYCDIRLRAAATGIFALVWWGILYPELCFTEDTFQKVIVADGREQAVDKADYRDILDAAGDEIVIRSRLLEWLEQQEWFRHGG